ncbi:MAG: F0F1 ATP synthase subunit A [Planctomycetes bacterium]|nr:F0F1 ATP synthase subunit A [Planctomycetota bacterium]
MTIPTMPGLPTFLRGMLALLTLVGVLCGAAPQHAPQHTAQPEEHTAQPEKHTAQPEAPAPEGQHAPAPQEPGDAQHASGAEHGGSHEALSTMEMGSGDFFLHKYSHLQPHAIALVPASGKPADSWFTFYDVNLFQLYALAVMLVVFLAVLASFRFARSPWLLRVFRGWCHWLRDEIVVSVMGEEDARKFAPYFIYLFFFIAFMNLLGMLPDSVTATATLHVTGALAMTTFGFMLIGGMVKQGVGAYWKNLLPHGVPVWLAPLLFVLEVIGLLVKPFALTIRLFANLLAGHLVIYSFIAMIFLFAKVFEKEAVSYGPAVVAVGMSVFISIIEAFVALLQAYIFTLLSTVFVQQSLHPEH